LTVFKVKYRSDAYENDWLRGWCQSNPDQSPASLGLDPLGSEKFAPLEKSDVLK